MNGDTSLPFASWPAPRKAAAIVFAFMAQIAAAVSGLYLAGALFLLLNKANPAQVRLTSAMHYWRLYSDDKPLRKKLVLALGAGGALQALPAAAVLATRRRRPLHGDARFATEAEIEQAGLFKATGPGFILGKFKGRYLHLGGQLSLMLSAPTRSGKGVSVVMPNLLNWPESAVALDVKGELFAITAGYRAAHGQAVYCFAPFDEQGKTHRWNPLTAVRTSVFHRVGDLLSIGQVLYPNDGSGTSSESFFNDQARNLFMGLGLLLLETPDLPRSIGEMLRQSSGKGRSLREHLTSLIAVRKEDARAFSDECTDALQRLLANSDNTLSSIVATFVAPLTIFANAIVDAATSADDFRLEDVRRRRMSVYMRIPPNRLDSSRPLRLLFFSQLVNLNTQALPEQDSTLQLQCAIVADEFATMGRISTITNGAAFLAGYGLRLLTVVQAMSQLDAVYGEKESRTFATNHGAQILFAPREQRDADEYSAMLGFFTERATSRGRSQSFSTHGHSSVSRNESDQRRALLMPQEFKELGSERLVIVLENCKPILAEKVRYFRDPALIARLLPPPAIKAINLHAHLARVQQRWRYADEELPAEGSIDIEALAHDLAKLPMALEGTPDEIAETLLNFFSGDDPVDTSGGAIEPIPDEDGVLSSSHDLPDAGDRDRRLEAAHH